MISFYPVHPVIPSKTLRPHLPLWLIFSFLICIHLRPLRIVSFQPSLLISVYNSIKYFLRQD